MTRFTAVLSLFGLVGGVVVAAPPAPTAKGISGATVSAAPDQGLVREAAAFARPRAGAFVTNLYPDARQAIPFRASPTAEIKVNETQEIVVFAPHRPVRIRLTVQIEGKPIAQMWRSRLRTMFDFFDRDHDGVLNGFEVQNVFSDTGIVQMLNNGIYQPTPQDRPSLERLDKDGDRKVSFDEFVAYYKLATAQLFTAQPPMAENPYNAATTEAIFKLIDANGDDKLTKDEVQALEKLIAKLDADEDECLSVTELVPDANNPGRVRQLGQAASQVQFTGAQGYTASPASQSVITYQVGRIPGTLTQQILKRFDKNNDYELTREESGFDEPTFARLDIDGNGRLDGEELDMWRTGPPDLEIAMSLSPKAVDCIASLVTDAKEVATRGFQVQQVESGRLIIRTGRQPIEFWAYSAVLAYSQQSLKTTYQYLFQQASGGKEFIIEKDLTGPNAVQFQFIRTLFDPADANSDGKLTKAEFNAYFDLQDQFRNVMLSVTPTVQTPTLFQLLDENNDGRLGVRELRTAWDRLVKLEPGNAEVITRAAILPSVSLRLTRGLDRFYINQVVQVNLQGQNPNQVAVPQKGPIWFRKMDRNADGDVSRSEFLGTKSEFDVIDTDHDELISLAEAQTYDKKMRAKDGTITPPPKKQ